METPPDYCRHRGFADVAPAFHFIPFHVEQRKRKETTDIMKTSLPAASTAWDQRVATVVFNTCSMEPQALRCSHTLQAFFDFTVGFFMLADGFIRALCGVSFLLCYFCVCRVRSGTKHLAQGKLPSAQ